jgi:TonB-dependent Receptor Plug Domain
MSPIHRRPARTTAFLSFAFTLGLSACASGSGASGSAAGGASDVITEQQIDDSGDGTALEVIQRYHPRWLRPSRNPTAGGVSAVTSRAGMPQKAGDATASQVYATVFLDGAAYGEISTLSSIDSRTVSTIEFVSGSDATTRWGTAYPGGVIDVHSRSIR